MAQSTGRWRRIGLIGLLVAIVVGSAHVPIDRGGAATAFGQAVRPGPAAADVNAVLITIDAPSPGATLPSLATISGWAIDPTATSGPGIAEVHIYIDGEAGEGRLLGGATYGLPRLDIAALYGPGFQNAGFAFRWDTRRETNGEHLLYVYARAADGWTYATVPVRITGGRPAPTPTRAPATATPVPPPPTPRPTITPRNTPRPAPTATPPRAAASGDELRQLALDIRAIGNVLNGVTYCVLVEMLDALETAQYTYALRLARAYRDATREVVTPYVNDVVTRALASGHTPSIQAATAVRTFHRESIALGDAFATELNNPTGSSGARVRTQGERWTTARLAYAAAYQRLAVVVGVRDDAFSEIDCSQLFNTVRSTGAHDLLAETARTMGEVALTPSSGEPHWDDLVVAESLVDLARALWFKSQ